MDKPRPEFHVIDGTAALFRAWFGAPTWQGSEGAELGAVKSMVQSLARYLRRSRPPYAAVVFDAGPWTFRNEIYPDYKANRGLPPEGLVPQFEVAKSAAEAMGLICFQEEGFEADDLMATLATRAEQAKLQCLLVTPDKDVLQLVSNTCSVIHPKDHSLSGPAEVHERFGVHAQQMIDYLALAGDPTDNIPGLPGVGPKTAQAILQHMDSIEALLANPEAVAELPIRGAKSLVGKITEGREDLLLSQRLVTLKQDVPLRQEPLRLGDLRFRGRTPEGDQFFMNLGMGPPPL